MATIIKCDRCLREIEKLPCKMKAIDREFEICNSCWKGWLEFMGRPFYKVESLPERRMDFKSG